MYILLDLIFKIRVNDLTRKLSSKLLNYHVR